MGGLPPADPATRTSVLRPRMPERMPALLVIRHRVVNRPLTCRDVRSRRSPAVLAGADRQEFSRIRGVSDLDTPPR